MKLSQRTLVRMMESFDQLGDWLEERAYKDHKASGFYYLSGSATDKHWSRQLYEHQFSDRFLELARKKYWNWDTVLRELRSGQFVREARLEPENSEDLLSRLAALIVVIYKESLPRDEAVLNPLIRSIEHDGFTVDTKNVKLLPTEGPVSHEEEESRLLQLVSSSGLTNTQVIRTHLKGAVDNYVAGTEAQDHASLGESRTLLQAVIDGVSEDIDKTGKSVVGLPGGTANRFEYLEKNGLIVTDERTMLGAAWGFLSAGNHPGVPPRELARIGLLFSMELSQMLILKWQQWRSNHP